MVNRIKELRESKGLQQVGLAIKLNTSQSTISAYELGTRTPDVSMLEQMATYFNVSIDYLVGYSDLKRPINGNKLSVEDMNLLADFERLSKREKEKVHAYIQGLLAADS